MRTGIVRIEVSQVFLDDDGLPTATSRWAKHPHLTVAVFNREFLLEQDKVKNIEDKLKHMVGTKTISD